MTEFVDSLNVSVTVSSGESSASVDGGNVKQLEFDLQLWGHSGWVRLWIIAENDADEYFDLVTAAGLLEIEFSAAKALYNVSPAPDPLKIKGIVTSRRIREVPSGDVKGYPILYREYTLHFEDAAQALWKQHRPSVVYARTKLDKVFKEHTPSKANVKLDWTALKKTRPMVCLGLGEDQASYYDFLFWLADRERGCVWYDYTAQALNIADDKPSVGEAQELAFGSILDTQSYAVEFAPLPREAVNLINSRDTATKEWVVEQSNSVDGVRRDYLIHTVMDAEAKDRQALEKARYTGGRYDVKVDCDAYPEMYLAPGTLVKLAAEFSDCLIVSGESLRLLRLRIAANATNQVPEFDIENSTTEYNASVSLELEPEDDVRFRAPRYVSPTYPVQVEGKVLSAVGQTDDRAYTVYDDDEYDLIYKVNFPNWNSTINVPVTPDFMPGHLYFPVYKDSRVFVALEFESARITRFLEWGKDVVVPNASQGNHLLLGRNDKSETSIKHWYVDSQPQLVIARNNAGDKGTVTVKEGLMTLELTEEGASTGFGATVSVEPEAQMAKAEAQQKTDLAVADLQDATDSASEELSGSAQQASTAIRQQAESLRDQIDDKAKSIDQALQGVSDGIDDQVQKVEDALTETQGQLEDLLK